jgi:hypothetical protein
MAVPKREPRPSPGFVRGRARSRTAPEGGRLGATGCLSRTRPAGELAGPPAPAAPAGMSPEGETTGSHRYRPGCSPNRLGRRRTRRGARTSGSRLEPPLAAWPSGPGHCPPGAASRDRSSTPYQMVGAEGPGYAGGERRAPL